MSTLEIVENSHSDLEITGGTISNLTSASTYSAITHQGSGTLSVSNATIESAGRGFYSSKNINTTMTNTTINSERGTL